MFIIILGSYVVVQSYILRLLLLFMHGQLEKRARRKVSQYEKKEREKGKGEENGNKYFFLNKM